VGERPMLTRRRHSIWRLVLVPALGLSLGAAGCTSAVQRPGRQTWETQYAHEDDVVRPHDAAPESLTTLRSLNDLLDHAEAHNPGLRAAFERWTAAEEQVPQARSLPDPRVSYAYFIEPVETRLGPQRQKFGFSQTIPLFGKLGRRGDIAIHATNVAGAEFENERLQMRLRITMLWNDYYYLGRAIGTTEENVRLVNHLESVALSQYAAGRTTHAAAIRAQVELGRLEDRLRTLRDQRRSLVAALNAELDRPADTPIPWPDSLHSTPVQAEPQELEHLLLQHNPGLVALRARAAQDSAAASLAGKGAIPDLTLGAEYIDIGPAVNPNLADSGKNAAMAMATINVPLWFGQYRAEASQARARRSSTVYALQQRENALRAELEKAHFEYRDAERRVDLYAFTLLPKARQAFEVTEDAFTTGDASFLDLIDAQRTLLEFELSYERALADRGTRRAQLVTLVGGNLTAAPEERGTP